MPPHVSLGSIRTDQLPGPRSAGEGKINLKALITSYTLLDFLSDGDMLAFFIFVEEHMVWHAANLRANDVEIFYVSRLFNKGDKCTIGNWLEYEDKEAFAACYKIWQQFLTDKPDKFNFVS